MELAPLERAVIEALLSRDEPGYDELRQQLGSCRVRSREMAGVGFYTALEVHPSAGFTYDEPWPNEVETFAVRMAPLSAALSSEADRARSVSSAVGRVVAGRTGRRDVIRRSPNGASRPTSTSTVP